MQYTVRNVTEHLDRALRRRARDEGKSLNETALEALRRGVGLDRETPRHRKLGDLAGTWVEDSDFDAAIAAQHEIDPKLWK